MRKIVSVLLLVLLVLSVMMVIPSSAAETLNYLVSFQLNVPSEGKEIDVTWNSGFVGSSGNQIGFENAIKSGSSSYRYSDVITIEKAGTTIWFTEKKSTKAHYTAYVISSWEKNALGEWETDLMGANYLGSAGKRSRICRNNGNGTCTYVYTTSKDNENIRLTTCMADSNATDYPKVYMAYTGEKGTRALQLEQDNAEVIYEKNGKVEGVLWFSGSVGSPERSDGETFEYEIHDIDGNYYYSSLIHIPYAGMKITFSDDSAPFLDMNYLSISSWTKTEDGFICDSEKPAFAGGNEDVETKWRDTCTYTYVSTEEDEYIRLCFLGSSVTFMPEVTWSGYWPEETTEEETTEEEIETTELSEDEETLLPPTDETPKGPKWKKIAGGCTLGGVTVLYGAYGVVRAIQRKKSDGAEG